MSIVRENLMNDPMGYTPYCGAENCRLRWPRTIYLNKQFQCPCGWRSSFEAAFIDQFESKRIDAGAQRSPTMHEDVRR